MATKASPPPDLPPDWDEPAAERDQLTVEHAPVVKVSKVRGARRRRRN